MLKILHVWDQAGVACTLAKYQQKLGHISTVIKRQGFDNFGILEFYGQKSHKTWSGDKFLKLATKEAENYDVIHIHDLVELVPRVKKNFKNKKIILHYHGSKLRKTPSDKRKEAENSANAILLSTPDLSRFADGIYVHNPVDVEHFSSRNIVQNNKALSLMSKTENAEELRNFLQENELKVDLNSIPRYEKPVLYRNMPQFLSNYEYYLDVKLIYDHDPMPALGLTGLQSLALGLKVINFEGKIKEGLPEYHKPENVVKEVMKCYG